MVRSGRSGMRTCHIIAKILARVTLRMVFLRHVFPMHPRVLTAVNPCIPLGISGCLDLRNERSETTLPPRYSNARYATGGFIVTDVAVENLEPEDVAQLLCSGRVLLIDVREPNEYQEQRIAGALLYPLSSFDASAPFWGTLPRIVFQCGSGKRSFLAAQRRLAAGATHIAHMKGGLGEWKARGLPLISANP